MVWCRLFAWLSRDICCEPGGAAIADFLWRRNSLRIVSRGLLRVEVVPGFYSGRRSPICDRHASMAMGRRTILLALCVGCVARTVRVPGWVRGYGNRGHRAMDRARSGSKSIIRVHATLCDLEYSWDR